ncbi:MAG TPA: nucleotidyl transferase AbiEii/AbiGii toxin family protein, partial [Gemmatimonadales bacterium]|nr:nucleotidyl transferase AbiEii/AbiGii toxin family protein [Gemmatimonadales bacterium]
YGLALAGGYAIKAHGLVTRPSDDVDFATGHGAPVEEITEALADAYRRAGFEVQVLRASGRKGHLDVELPSGAAYRVDVLKEPLNHSPTMMSFVPVLALADAVALKVGALHDRGLLRAARPPRRSGLEGRFAQRVSLPVRRSAGVPGGLGVTVSSRR